MQINEYIYLSSIFDRKKILNTQSVSKILNAYKDFRIS